MRSASRTLSFTSLLATATAVGSVSLLVPACDGTDDGTLSAHGAASAEEASPTPTASVTPTPVASLTLSSGNVIEIYGFDHRALVMERGTSGRPSALAGPPREGATLVDMWKDLSPKTPVPQALEELQRRVTLAPHNASQVGVLSTDGASLDQQPVAQADDDLLASQQGCTNDCCDPDKLAALCPAVTNLSGYSNWNLFNYGWSVVSAHNVDVAKTLVCSAIGTSAWHLNLDNHDYHWTVSEGGWLSYFWYDSGWIWNGENLSSWVNDQNNQHLHTNCGYVRWH